MTPSQEVIVGGVRTRVTTRRELARLMVEDCEAARSGRLATPRLVFSSNGQGIALAGRDQSFLEAMDAADITHADGMPVVLASRFTRTPLPERIATTDFFHDAAAAAVESGLRFFVLGSTEEQNAAAASAMIRLYPGLNVVGRHHGFFSDEDEDAVCDIIRSAEPDVVWVALGKPKQEQWCVRNRHKLGGVGWLKTCGGLLAFLTGSVGRAPLWMQRSGTEWLYRALEDPKRLGWRYLSTNPYAAYRLVTQTRNIAPGAETDRRGGMKIE